MSPDLPPALRAGAEALLEGTSGRTLAQDSANLTNAYRSGAGSASAVRSAGQVAAYALARLPATYAACASAMQSLAAAAPDFAPATLLDAGAGPGGASWAACEMWASLTAVSMMDANGPFLELAARLAAGADGPLSQARLLRQDLTHPDGSWPSAELVLCSYALAEIGPESQEGVVGRLWEACSGILLLVEPGTPAGFQRIALARRYLLGAGATLLAPCTHAQACPIEDPDWCHFVQRLPRSRSHLMAKQASVPFEDEKFAYLAAARPAVASKAKGAGRIIGPVRSGKAGLEMRLCTADGVVEHKVPRRDKAAHAAHRRLQWGDIVDL